MCRKQTYLFHRFQFCSLKLHHWSSSRLGKTQTHSLRKGQDPPRASNDCASLRSSVQRQHLHDTRQLNYLLTRTLFKTRFCIFTSAQTLHLPAHLPVTGVRNAWHICNVWHLGVLSVTTQFMWKIK